MRIAANEMQPKMKLGTNFVESLAWQPETCQKLTEDYAHFHGVMVGILSLLPKLKFKFIANYTVLSIVDADPNLLVCRVENCCAYAQTDDVLFQWTT